MLKMLTIASMSLALMTGTALAQTPSTDSSSTPSAETPDAGTNSPTTPTNEMSADEAAMMEEWRGREGFVEAFFTDDTMVTLRSEDEIATNFGAMPAEQQDMMRADCDKLNNTPGENAAAASRTLCAAIGEL